MSILWWIVWGLLPPLVHEFGHWITGKILGYSIKFYLKGFRFIWHDPPYETEYHAVLINQSGFGFEMAGLIPAIFFDAWIPYVVVLLIHWWAYPWYAGANATDFDNMIRGDGKK